LLHQLNKTAGRLGPVQPQARPVKQCSQRVPKRPALHIVAAGNGSVTEVRLSCVIPLCVSIYILLFCTRRSLGVYCPKQPEHVQAAAAAAAVSAHQHRQQHERPWTTPVANQAYHSSIYTFSADMDSSCAYLGSLLAIYVLIWHCSCCADQRVGSGQRWS
jgi:hypothetical protein